MAWADAPRTQAAVLSAAGDIACDPSSMGFNRGRGTATECRALATSRLLRGSDVVVPLGDAQGRHGSFKNYRRSYDRSWGRFLRITRPVIGNHDYGPPEDPNLGSGGYWHYFGERRAGPRKQGWYSFDIGSWHVIALNSMCEGSSSPHQMQPKVGCDEGSRQMKWLKQDLAQNESSCILASWHHPRFTSSKRHRRGVVAPFWRTLDAAGADVVLSGHQHVYERFAPQHASGTRDSTGIRQFVVGTGGESIGSFRSKAPNSQKRLREFGVLRLNLKPSSYSWKFATPGRKAALDRGETSCG